ncbi:hypothetical protein J6590_078500 [Homalodisca vitripennis]|nr:hypothetical protein J6590_078500 [Homalodisca vitripennis]
MNSKVELQRMQGHTCNPTVDYLHKLSLTALLHGHDKCTVWAAVFTDFLLNSNPLATSAIVCVHLRVKRVLLILIYAEMHTTGCVISSSSRRRGKVNWKGRYKSRDAFRYGIQRSGCLSRSSLVSHHSGSYRFNLTIAAKLRHYTLVLASLPVNYIPLPPQLLVHSLPEEAYVGLICRKPLTAPVAAPCIVTAERSCPCKQPACPAIGGRSEVTFNPLIKKMYKFRPKHAKYFMNLLPSRDKNVFEQCLLTVLPNRDQHGSRILMIEAGDKWKPKEVSLTELLRGVLLVLEAAILEPRTQISGSIVLIDLRGLSMHHVWQFSPGFASMIVEWVQELIPCRIKAIHIVNQPYIFNMLFSIFKPFLQEKLRNRIHFHGEDRASLLNHIDAKSVPTQYGGDMYLPHDQGLELHRLLCLYDDQYQKTSEYGYVNISKQKGKDKKEKRISET